MKMIHRVRCKRLCLFCYALQGGAGEYRYHEPTQKPIDPPYKTALASKRGEDVEHNLETQMSDCTL